MDSTEYLPPPHSISMDSMLLSLPMSGSLSKSSNCSDLTYISPSTSCTFDSMSTLTRSRANSNCGEALASEIEGDLYIFGYGSLVWAPSFPSERSYNSYITGYKRRFYQGSRDHRGTDSNPGRVVTLLTTEECNEIESAYETSTGKKIRDTDTDSDDRVYGVTYQVNASEKLKVLQYLDEREKSGYTVQLVTVYIVPDENDNSNECQLKTVQAIVYIGLNNNSDYIGPSSYPSMAYTIYHAHGKSGPNYVYFHNLYIYLKRNNLYDEHIELLSLEIEKLQDEIRYAKTGNINTNPIMLPLSVTV